MSGVIDYSVQNYIHAAIAERNYEALNRKAKEVASIAYTWDQGLKAIYAHLFENWQLPRVFAFGTQRRGAVTSPRWWMPYDVVDANNRSQRFPDTGGRLALRFHACYKDGRKHSKWDTIGWPLELGRPPFDESDKMAVLELEVSHWDAGNAYRDARILRV